MPLSGARTAVSASSTDPRIGLIVWVPLRAVGAPQLPCSNTLPSPHVLGLSDSLKVGWINTGPVAAEMVKYQPVGNSSIGYPVSNAVRWAPLPTDNEPAISASVDGGNPDKAIVFWQHLRPESLLKRLQKLGAEMSQRITVPVPAVVVRFAPTVGLVADRFIAFGNSARGGCHTDSVSHVRRVQPSP